MGSLNWMRINCPLFIARMGKIAPPAPIPGSISNTSVTLGWRSNSTTSGWPYVDHGFNVSLKWCSKYQPELCNTSEAVFNVTGHLDQWVMTASDLRPYTVYQVNYTVHSLSRWVYSAFVYCVTSRASFLLEVLVSDCVGVWSRTADIRSIDRYPDVGFWFTQLTTSPSPSRCFGRQSDFCHVGSTSLPKRTLGVLLSDYSRSLIPSCWKLPRFSG